MGKGREKVHMCEGLMREGKQQRSPVACRRLKGFAKQREARRYAYMRVIQDKQSKLDLLRELLGRLDVSHLIEQLDS